MSSMIARLREALWIPMIIWLTGAWVLMWGELSPANVASGLLIGIGVMVLLPLPRVVIGGRVHPVELLRLIGRFIADLVIASVEVSAQVLRFGQQPRGAVVRVDLRSRSDLYLTITAELLTLVPGSVVIEARRSTSTLFLHLLRARDDRDVARGRSNALAQEERVVRAFGSAAEVADLEQAKINRREEQP